MSSSFNSAPTVVLPPAADQHFVKPQHFEQNQVNQSMSDAPPTSHAYPQSHQYNTDGTISGSLAGRKRSRGDIFSAVDEEEGPAEDGSIPNPVRDDQSVKPRGDPVHGPGMTLLYPDDPGYAMAVESQSGTWVEETTERSNLGVSHTKRPSVTSRKSQRVDSTASGPDDLAQLVLPPQMREVTSEPLIDEATRSLGISWTRMDSSEALIISKTAYAKWIQNHYPGLKDVSIWFENSAIPGYLVAANNSYNGQHEYYIFSHDLTEARLVTTEPSQLLPRLKMLPALHLAAPGGHIKAETDPITAAQNELYAVQAGMADEIIHHDNQSSFACTAHAMELD